MRTVYRVKIQILHNTQYTNHYITFLAITYTNLYNPRHYAKNAFTSTYTSPLHRLYTLLFYLYSLSFSKGGRGKKEARRFPVTGTASSLFD